MSEVTVGDQQELCDAAWVLLKKHRRAVTVDLQYCSDYDLAKKIALAVTEVRDRQLEHKVATSDTAVL